MEVKAIPSQYLYNMLQDFRHILVFDLRNEEQFNESKIRDSFLLGNNVSQCSHIINTENISDVV